MDDLYQYTSNALNDNNQQEQDDPLIKAFSNFGTMGWGRWHSLVDTVKKQGEAFVDVTKKDLQEFASVLRDDGTDIAEHLSQSTTSEKTVTTQQDGQLADSSNSSTTSFAALRDGLDKINPFNLTSLRDGLTDTLSQLPSQISSTVKLPDNIKLGELQRELDQGTKFAEQYLQSFGSEVLHALQRTVTVLDPEDDSSRSPETTVSKASSRIFATRKEALQAKMQSDPNNFLLDPRDGLSESEQSVFDTFVVGFHINEYTDEIARLLDANPDLRQTMDDLVPVQVDYTHFWQRYFYHTWKIDQEEQRRQMIVKGADHDDDDFKWDSDDEDLVADASSPLEPSSSALHVTTDKGKQPDVHQEDASHDTNKSDTDYSNISGPPSTEASLVSPPLKSQNDAEDWVKPKADHPENNDDSDSDWE
ncbi:BSD-domain-containing protein [Hesseltinella vesiculosa]|uniref:BSD-domain-containing protein n=1 Tax=Hesseltinella vesiculosa TaxID=101127 RepID=A0A1X2G3V2_9FUNG|nr:BSD-domain-containing protein [Hesseltinella vesiculosa]